MEIVLAVLLLFGGFTLGSITADKSGDDVRTTMALPNVDGVSDSYQVTQAMHQSNPTRCRSDRVVIYRDLTVPYHDKTDQQAGQSTDCDGECPNE
ncbi:MAG: hypothetical protein U9Q19_00080 [Pseudomonadota bacterium]|nr:hypothetical protein [Pseudomonadota bacterium]